MIDKESFDRLRSELSVKAKNGLDFTCAASIIWLAIGYIWTLNQSAYTKSIFTFYVGAIMLPLAFLFSKLFKTTWTLKDNPLQPLGLWLNFAQLFYFPFLFFTLAKLPDHFVMVYAIITGAHFFPYSWFYKNRLFAVAAGIIVVGALLLGLRLPAADMYLIPLSLSFSLLVLTVLLYFDYKGKEQQFLLA